MNKNTKLALKMICINVIKHFKTNILNYIVFIGFIISPILLYIYNNYIYIIILNTILLILFLVLKQIRKFNKVLDIPVARKRFTINNDDMINYKYNEINEMVQYLCSVEDYLSRYGVYEKK